MPTKVKSKKQKRTHKFALLSVGGILALILILGAFIYSYLFALQTRTYVNNDLHFSLDIPQGWTTHEGKNIYGSPKAEIVSGNKEITIDINDDSKFPKQFKTQLPEVPDVELGKYKLARARYDTNGVVTDYIDLYNIPGQYSLKFSFTINGDFDRNNKTLLKVLKTFKYTEKEKPTSTYFTYSLPEGWKKGSDDFMGTSFVSGDHKVSEGGGYTNAGVLISVRRELMQKGKTLDDLIQEFPDKVTQDITPIKIDGIEGFTRHQNWESHAQVFLVQKGNYVWRITAITKDLSDEYNHRGEIDSFIESLHFK